MNIRISRLSLAAALALGGVAGFFVGTGLPRTLAQAPTAPGLALTARLARLENRVDGLDAQVKRLKSGPTSIVSPYYNYGDGNSNSFDGSQPAQPQWKWQIVPVGK